MSVTVPSSASLAAIAGTWEVDPAHTTVEFRVRHAGLARVRGVFHEFDGTVEIGADGSVAGRGSVAAASLDTRIAARDEHLRSADFFDAENHPRLELVASSIEVAGEELTARAELTIRGITRPVTLTGELIGSGRDDEGAERVGLVLSGRIDRRDYGLTWNAAIDGGGLLVGNAVDLHLEISAVRRA